MDNMGGTNGEREHSGEGSVENSFDSVKSVEFSGDKEQESNQAESPVSAEQFVPSAEKQTNAGSGGGANNSADEWVMPEYVEKASKDFQQKTSAPEYNDEKKVIDAAQGELEGALKIESPFEMVESINLLKKAFRAKIENVRKK